MKCLFSLMLMLSFVTSFSQKLKPHVVAKLPDELHEISGMIFREGKLLALNDGGNPNLVYEIDTAGIIHHEYETGTNHDWEELTSDNRGNIYIGDFGNNLQRRINLSVLTISSNSFQNIVDTSLKTSVESQQLSFLYFDQNEIPPRPDNWNFDCEAFVHEKDSLYLFSKNLSNDKNGFTKCYRISDSIQQLFADKADSFMIHEPVTGTALSDDDKTLVVLTYFSLWIFKNYEGTSFFNGDVYRFQFKRLTQKESVCFVSPEQLLIADEKHLGVGGKLYSLSLGDLDFSKSFTEYHAPFFKKLIYDLYNNPKAKYRKWKRQPCDVC